MVLASQHWRQPWLNSPRASRIATTNLSLSIRRRSISAVRANSSLSMGRVLLDFLRHALHTEEWGAWHQLPGLPCSRGDPDAVMTLEAGDLRTPLHNPLLFLLGIFCPA